MARSKKKKRLRLLLLAGAGAAGFIAYKYSSGGPVEAVVRKELEKRYGSEAADRILTTFRAEYAELRKDGKQAAGVMRFHLTSARQGLALYRALAAELASSEEAVDAAHEIMWKCFLRTPSILLGYLLGMSGDPFAVYARGVDWVNTHIFPPAGWEASKVEVENGIGFDYTGCFYHDYLREKGAPELIPAFCEMDVKQAECFPTSIRFERTRMLSKGDDRCDFRFYRQEKT
jgi:hypothetical protein